MKGQQFIHDVGAIERMMQAKACDPGQGHMLGDQRARFALIDEVVGIKAHQAGFTTSDLVKRDRSLEQPAQMEGLQLELPPARHPQSAPCVDQSGSADRHHR